MAAFGRAGDYLRIYEINQEVQRPGIVALTYLSNCPGKVEVALGMPAVHGTGTVATIRFTCLDAFSSDAIPCTFSPERPLRFIRAS